MPPKSIEALNATLPFDERSRPPQPTDIFVSQVNGYLNQKVDMETLLNTATLLVKGGVDTSSIYFCLQSMSEVGVLDPEIRRELMLKISGSLPKKA